MLLDISKKAGGFQHILTNQGAYDDEQSVETENTENNDDLMGVNHTKHTHHSFGSI